MFPRSIEVNEIASDELRSKTPPRGVKTLREWRAFFEATGYRMPTSDGRSVEVSLADWADSPGDTLLQIRAAWIDPKMVGTKDPDAGTDR